MVTSAAALVPMGNCTMRVYQSLSLFVLACCRPARATASHADATRPQPVIDRANVALPSRDEPTLALSDEGFCSIEGQARTLRCGGQFGAGAIMADTSTRSFAVGARYGCAVLGDRTLRCWGRMFSTGMTFPAPPPRPPETVAGIDAIEELYGSQQSLVARVANGALRWVYTVESERSDLANAQRPRVLEIPGIDRVVRFEWIVDDQLAVAERDDHTWYTLAFQTYRTAVEPTALGVLGAVARWSRRARPCAMRVDGTVVCVAPDGPMLPLREMRPVRDAVEFAAADGRSRLACVRTRGGSVYCWNDSRDRKTLLDGATDLQRGPVEVPALRDARSVAIQGDAVCAALASGRMRCTNATLYRPSERTGFFSQRPEVLVGPREVDGVSNAQTLVLATNPMGSVCAIGDGASGRCVDASFHAETPGLRLSSYPREAFETRDGWFGDESQQTMRCRAQSDHAVRCSPSLSKRLARAAEEGQRSGVAVFGVGDSRVFDVALDRDGGCAILDDARHSVRCWAMDLHDASPVEELTDTVEVALGRGFRCARDVRGAVRCWGDGRFGQRGDGALGVRARPDTDTIAEGAAGIAAGVAHACARMNDGTVRCWGWNEIAQLGDRSLASSATPMTVAGLRDVRSIRAGAAHTCALLADRSVWCWGTNADYECGVEQPARIDAPVEVVSARGASEIAVNGGASCARFDRATDTVRCWGRGAALVLPPDEAQRLHDERRGDASAPPWWQVRLAALDGAQAISVGPSRVCGRMVDRSVRCVDSEYVLE